MTIECSFLLAMGTRLCDVNIPFEGYLWRLVWYTLLKYSLYFSFVSTKFAIQHRDYSKQMVIVLSLVGVFTLSVLLLTFQPGMVNHQIG